MGIKVRGMEKTEIEKVIEELYHNKVSWRKSQACFKNPFDSSLSKIGG
jgi:hypothetical protein